MDISFKLKKLIDVPIFKVNFLENKALYKKNCILHFLLIFVQGIWLYYDFRSILYTCYSLTIQICTIIIIIENNPKFLL